MFKGMTAIFRDRIDVYSLKYFNIFIFFFFYQFAEINAKSEELVAKYGVDSFPTLMVLEL